MVWLLYANFIGAIIAGTNENDRKVAENTVRGRDFNLCDPVSRQALLEWLKDLMQKIEGEVLKQHRNPSRMSKFTESLQNKIAKMIPYVTDDVPKFISKNVKPFYGTGGGIGKESAWIDLDDVILMSAFLKSKCLCFNEYTTFDTNRPSRGPDQNLQWYQAVAIGNGEDAQGDHIFQRFTFVDIKVLLQDPRFCSLTSESVGAFSSDSSSHK